MNDKKRTMNRCLLGPLFVYCKFKFQNISTSKCTKVVQEGKGKLKGRLSLIPSGLCWSWAYLSSWPCSIKKIDSLF